MLNYVIRRVLYMVPTVFGIILITFFLFSRIGWDPAANALGKNATAILKETFDVGRGYNKPPLAGLWGTIRAYEDSDFATTAGPWKMVPGVTHSNSTASIFMPAGTNYAVPLAFSLYPSNSFQWSMSYRVRGEPAAPATSPPPVFTVTNASGPVVVIPLESDGRIHSLKVEFATDGKPDSCLSVFRVTGGTVELKSLSLRRRGAHYLDSQLWFYLKQLYRRDLGVSVATNQRVASMMAEGVLPSLALTVPMFIVGLVVSISLALFCAFFRNTFVDRFFVVFSVILMSVNYLVWIVLGQFFLGYTLRAFPVWGYESARYLLLPCIIGIVSGLGSELRFYRTVMLDEMYRDYVRTAFAKGLSRRKVLFKHVLKNAMIPILTGVIMEIPFLYTGSLLLESFFGIPGLGRMGINAIFSCDIDVVRSVVLIGAVIYVIANLVTDLCYALVDPRVRLK